MGRRADEETSSLSASCFIGQLPAPWQLNTPTTPFSLFMFHILSRLQMIGAMTGLKWTAQRNYFQILEKVWTFDYLFPSMTGSLNKQSRVGRPASRALRTDPSGSTSFLRILKSWFPGLSLQSYKESPSDQLMFSEMFTSSSTEIRNVHWPYIHCTTTDRSCCSVELCCLMLALKEMGKGS